MNLHHITLEPEELEWELNLPESKVGVITPKVGRSLVSGVL